MPPRIDELTRERLRETLGQMYVNNEPVAYLQGLWTMPETPPPETRHIDERLLEGYLTHHNFERMEPLTMRVDFGTNPDGTSAFVSAFNDALRKNRKEAEEYKRALDKQWNELMFGQAQ